MIANFVDGKSDLQKNWILKVKEAFSELYDQADLDFLSDTILPNVSIGSSGKDTGIHSLTDAYETFENYIAAYLNAYAGTDSAVRKNSYSEDYKRAAKTLYTLQFIPHAIQELYNSLGKTIFTDGAGNDFILLPDNTKGFNPRCWFSFTTAKFNFWCINKVGGWNYVQVELDFTGNKNYDGFNVFTTYRSQSIDPCKNLFKITFADNVLGVPKRKTIIATLEWFTKTNIENTIKSLGA